MSQIESTEILYNAELERASSIKTLSRSEPLHIKSRFYLGSGSNIGLILIAVLSICFSVLFLLYSESWFLLIIGLTLGIMLFTFSVVTMIKQMTDYLLVSNTKITALNSLRKVEIELTRQTKVKMESSKEFVALKSKYLSGSYFRTIEIFVVNKEERIRVFDFQVDEQYSADANKYGSSILKYIKSQIKNLSNN